MFLVKEEHIHMDKSEFEELLQKKSFSANTMNSLVLDFLLKNKKKEQAEIFSWETGLFKKVQDINKQKKVLESVIDSLLKK